MTFCSPVGAWTAFVAGLTLASCGATERIESTNSSQPPAADAATADAPPVTPDASPPESAPEGALRPGRSVPQAPAAPDATTDVEEYPLLGSSRGGHVWHTFCAAQPDDAPLPVDPRTLIQAHVNDDGAVYFNAFWVECEDDAPKTCGEYRRRVASATQLMENGGAWAYGGDQADAMLTISAGSFNGTWRDWGLRERPADFERRVSERWGVPLADKRNPYPLPDEDAGETNGGSGQLPVGMTQLRDSEGSYLGQMSFNCHWCHTGKVGESSEGEGLGTRYGSGNSLVDLSAGFGKFLEGLSGLIPIAGNKVRGTGNILVYPAIALMELDRAQHFNGSLLAVPSQGSVDYPAWWNSGHRTRRFHDGSFAMDDPRPVMGFYMPLFTYSSLLDLERARKWMDERDDSTQLWLEALTAPAYPGTIDRALAEAGAVLFHDKDLWAPKLANPARRPEGGNGSCASCHGVYSPRYAHDARYLARPELEGMAAYVVPIDVIDTDRAHFASLNDGLKETLAHSWWAYGTNEEEGACFGTVGQGGYLAPPLYGIWATAPYFHNGSVPNVWEVLKPSERKPIWRRVSAPPPADDPQAFMGFDANLARAYDHDRLGWRYDELACGAQPELDCAEAQPDRTSTAEAQNAGPYDDVWFTWNLAIQPQDAASLEARKIYNTHAYSQSNRGHEFTRVLTDPERRALLEYLKTL